MRYIEIDLARTFAIGLMILYHTLFLLWSIVGVSIDPFSGLPLLIARTSAILFLLLVGISYVIANKNRTSGERWKRAAQRFGGIGTCALGVSLATHIYQPEAYIQFGILHCIALSMLLLPIFVTMRKWNFLTGIILLLLHDAPQAFHSNFTPLLPFGIRPEHYITLDYYPLVPWLGYILIGLALGNTIVLALQLHHLKESRLLRILSWPGRHALLLYLIHPPILVLIITLLYA